MKRIILGIVLIILVVGLVAHYEGTSAPAQTKTSQRNWLESTVKKIGSALASPTKPLAGGNGQASVESDGDFNSALSKVNDLSRKAIPTEEERQELKMLLSNKANIDAAVTELKTYSAQNVREDQKRRMKAGLFFLNALAAKDSSANQYVRDQAAALVLDPSLEMITDPDLKRSVVADRVELLMTLKKRYPTDAEQISGKASTDLQKKMMAFATSFLNLNKKGT